MERCRAADMRPEMAALEIHPSTSVPMQIETGNRREIMIMNEIRNIFLSCLFGAVLLASMPAWASSPIASLRQVQGAVLVEHAAGYRRAANGAELKIGDRLVVLEGASAVVVGRGGCVVRLAENGHFVVGRGDDCSAVVRPAAATLLAEAIGFEPTGTKSDVGTGGFGAIGAEPSNKLTPAEIKRAEEAADLPDARNAKSAVSGGDKASGATPAGGDAPTTVVAARKPIRANAPSKGKEAESFFTGGGSVATVAGAIAGGVGLIVALAGGGGGAGGTDPGPPISSNKPSQNNGGGSGTGNTGGGSVGGGQPPVLSPQ